MNKSFMLLFLVVFSCSSLKINHNNHAPSHTSPESNASEEAFNRFIEFIFADQDLVDGFFSGQGLNDDQEQKVSSFLIKDPFYQAQIINDIESNEETSWFKDLSQDAKARFLTIITSVPKSQIDNGKSSKQVISQLQADSQIGPVLKNHYGDNIPSDFLSSTQSSLSSRTLGAHQSLFKFQKDQFTKDI